MDKLTPPDPLDLDSSNVSDAWRKWRQRFKLFSLASGLSSKDEGIQAATLQHVVRPDALEVYNTFPWEDADDKSKSWRSSKHIVCHRKISRGKDMCSILATNTMAKPLTSMSQT